MFRRSSTYRDIPAPQTPLSDWKRNSTGSTSSGRSAAPRPSARGTNGRYRSSTARGACRKLRSSCCLLTTLDLDAFAPQPAAKEADVIIVCRLVKNKGLFLLLDALALAKRHKPDISLHIVGEGPLKDALTRHLAQHGLQHNVRLLGWLPDQAAVARAYNAARVVVCASFNEGGPRTTLEGMACGLPAISTPVGAMPEVIAQGENGYLVDWTPESLSEALLSVLESESLQQRLGAAARAAVQPFAYEAGIRRYAEGYLRLIGAVPCDSTSFRTQ